MKKTAVIFTILFAVVFLFMGCKDEKDLPTNQIRQLEVWSAIENEQDIYHLKYPYCYYAIDDKTLECSRYEFENAIPVGNLSEEDYIYLTEYIMNLEDISHDADDIETYRISLYYYDENGVEQWKSIWGYNEFPEGWSEFISCVNTICGEDYLSLTGDIVEVTPRFLASNFRVTDEEVKEGTLADVIKQNDLDIYDVSEIGFDMDSELEQYYADIMEEYIAPFRPVQLELTDCTQEEYDAFIELYLDELGGDWEELKSDQPNFRYFRSTIDSKYFYIGKSMDLEMMELEFDDTYGYYKILLNAHIEDMIYGTDFYYNNNSKFILVDVSDTDMILTYIDIGAEEQ